MRSSRGWIAALDAHQAARELLCKNE